MIKMIWAESDNKIIGDKGGLIWDFKKDLNNFKRLTSGNTIVMGRKTAESLPKALPNRDNLVITRDLNWDRNGFIKTDMDDIIELSKKQDVFIIGGNEIYNLFLPLADELFITVINHSYSGDTKAPEIDLNNWDIRSIKLEKENEVTLLFVELVNKK